MKDRVDKSRGIVSLIPEGLTKIKTTESLRLVKYVVHRKRKQSDSLGQFSRQKYPHEAPKVLDSRSPHSNEDFWFSFAQNHTHTCTHSCFSVIYYWVITTRYLVSPVRVCVCVCVCVCNLIF
jgi:hypothetical protein